jgi:hypothetical protein
MASLATVKPGDIVEIDRKGRRFHAVVLEKGTGLLTRIRPLEPNITWTTATSREVVKHWRLTANRRKVSSTAGHDAD